MQRMEPTELCNWENPRKKVRVRAQIASQTTFLRLIGIEDFILTAASVSETAVLDVALVLDTSESMSTETNETHYQAIGLQVPNGLQTPLALQYPDGSSFSSLYRSENDDELQNAALYSVGPNLNATGQRTIRYGCIKIPDGEAGDFVGYTASGAKPRIPGGLNLTFGGCCNDPGNGNFLILDEVTGSWTVNTASRDIEGDIIPSSAVPGVTSNAPDGDFTDLVCEPFKQVKDAARNFIQRLDFVRGDRVAMVTFDTWGRILFDTNRRDVQGRIEGVFSDNLDSDSEFVDAENNILLPPMISNEDIAVELLNRYVGVRVNTSGTAASCEDWELAFDAIPQMFAFRAPDGAFALKDGTTVWQGSGEFQRRRWEEIQQDAEDGKSPPLFRGYDFYAPCTNTNVGDGIFMANNALTNAVTIRRDAVWVAILLTDGGANASGRAGDRIEFRNLRLSDASTTNYSDHGYCPWYTICNYNQTVTHTASHTDSGNVDIMVPCTTPGECNIGAYFGGSGQPYYNECNQARTVISAAYGADYMIPFPGLNSDHVFCQDNRPQTRHFCLEWTTDATTTGARQTPPRQLTLIVRQMAAMTPTTTPATGPTSPG
ncbi:MAG: VWA domain-containing protein [Anaerolineae bacterium]|nr:VWA domain-containing protein [Anaerolineae bacterium]